MKKIVITAPTSVVSKNYIRHIKDKYEVITVGRRESDIVFDFARDHELELPNKVETIVHFAGVIYENSPRDICEMINTNVGGLIKIADAAKRCGVGQIIYISSINATLSENSPYYGYYSMTKRHGEEAIRFFGQKEGIDVCVIRPSQIFGPDPDYGKVQAFLYLMIRNALDNNPILIYGNKDPLRNYIYADNLFSIIDEAIERKSISTIDAISPENITIYEMARTIVRVADSSSEILFLKNKPDIEDNSFVTNSNYFTIWKLPFVNFESAIKKTIQGVKMVGV